VPAGELGPRSWPWFDAPNFGSLPLALPLALGAHLSSPPAFPGAMAPRIGVGHAKLDSPSSAGVQAFPGALARVSRPQKPRVIENFECASQDRRSSGISGSTLSVTEVLLGFSVYNFESLGLIHKVSGGRWLPFVKEPRTSSSEHTR